MTLDRDVLHAELRAFGDDGFDRFEGYPPLRAAARARWAAAFHTYVSDMVVVDPDTVSPANTSATFAAVEAAFRNRIQLNKGMSAPVAARDIADAWRDGVEAIALVPGALYAGPGTAIAAIDAFPAPMLTTRHTTLVTVLTALFQSPNIDAVDRLARIASALHDATSNLATTCTHAVGGGSSVDPLVFG